MWWLVTLSKCECPPLFLLPLPSHLQTPRLTLASGRELSQLCLPVLPPSPILVIFLWEVLPTVSHSPLSLIRRCSSVSSSGRCPLYHCIPRTQLALNITGWLIERVNEPRNGSSLAVNTDSAPPTRGLAGAGEAAGKTVGKSPASEGCGQHTRSRRPRQTAISDKLSEFLKVEVCPKYCMGHTHTLKVCGLSQAQKRVLDCIWKPFSPLPRCPCHTAGGKAGGDGKQVNKQRSTFQIVVKQ